MNLPTITVNENCERVVSLWRNGERVRHVFPDHWLELREVAENGRGPLYYIIAHNYGTGEETLLFLENQKEYDILDKEMARDFDHALSFKKSVDAYNSRNIGKDFVKAVEAIRCAKFCDAFLSETAHAKPIEVGFGVEPRISDKDLKELCCRPLKATTDALRLKELEERFPGATMVLSNLLRQTVVKYVYEDMYVDNSANHKIACDFEALPQPDFASIGSESRPQLMAEWRGMYIDLSHLF
jgi:hypothetical protein